MKLAMLRNCNGAHATRAVPFIVPVKPMIFNKLVRAPMRCAPPDVALATAQEALDISIPTADARNCIRFELVPRGTGQAIVVQAVAEGSSAEQAGVVVGMRLTAISDPVRRDDVWELQDRPSIRYIRDVLRMRAPAFILLRFDPPEEQTLAALSAAATAAAAADGILELGPSAAAAAANSASSTSSSSRSSTSATSSLDSLESLSALSSVGEAGGSEQQQQQTMAERLQQQYEQAQQADKALTAVQQRQQRRKEYMEAAKERDDNGFLAVVAASFVLPAFIILLVAYTSGYLDNLYSNSLSNFR